MEVNKTVELSKKSGGAELTGYPSIDKPWLAYYRNSPDYDAPSTDCSIYDFLRECNKQNLQANALNYFGKKISFQDMFAEIDRIAAGLNSCGVEKGEIVSICGLNTPEFVELVYAVNKIGAVSNELGLSSPVADLHESLVSTESKVVIAVDVAYDKIMEASKNSCVEKIIRVPLDYSMPSFLRLVIKAKTVFSGKKTRSLSDKAIMVISWSLFLKNGKRAIPEVPQIMPNDLAFIVYTGGSTGVPKGVMLSNKNLNSYYKNLYKAHLSKLNNYNRNESYLSYVPIFFAFGASACIHCPLCQGMELILSPDPDPATVIKLIFRMKPKHIVGGKPLIDGLISRGDRNHDLSYVKSVMYGGEGADENWESKAEEVLKRHHMMAPILNGYGMTETAGAILFAMNDEKRRMLTFPDVNVKITDPEDSNIEFGYDTEGELCFSSDTVMMGYFNNGEETAEVFFEADGKKWLKTHDLAMISEDGTIRITGRIKRLYYKLTQNNILARVYPMRIEEVITSLTEIKKCAVVGVTDETTSYRTVCYLIKENESEGEDIIKEKVDCLCKKQLPESHIPDEYVFVNEFPLTRAGKIDYKALEERS